MRVRYDTRDENGKTRRERNEDFDRSELTPDYAVPFGGEHLWDWYFDMSARLRRTRDGVCEPIPPSEWVAWAVRTGEIVYPREHAILDSMDVAFCDEMNKELADYQARQADKTGKK